MMRAEKITSVQLGLILFTFVVSTINLSVPGQMAMFGKQDAWLSVFPSVTTGLLCIWVMIKLGKRYPGLTIIEYSSQIVGKWAGKLIGVNYIYYWFVSITTITYQHSMFINTLLLPKSPHLVGSMTLLILCGFAVYAGIEVVGRSNEFLTPLLMAFVFPLFILTLQEIHPNNFKPILGDGFWPVLQGAVLPACAFMNQLFILGWLLPFSNQPKKARKVALIALAGITGILLTVVSLSILVLGPLTGRLSYSFLSVIQYIGIEGSFERLEAIAVSIWVMGCFVKSAICLFILCLCVSQLFGIRDYRDLVFPCTLLATLGSVWIFRNGADLQNYIVFTFPILALFNQSIIPLLLLVIDTIRRKAVASRH
ncbi:GerAB/ArcD/ProY family transporter [Paenibacillus koleovorans]|uniref:GerAB/ArcD/ProY family transporter n=1 Tax=Paenibacillus koleovorans TaxID=121608 RepID=UPI000FD96874|nr:endospore germination permease [Paenibacillus koleovorans]